MPCVSANFFIILSHTQRMSCSYQIILSVFFLPIIASVRYLFVLLATQVGRKQLFLIARKHIKLNFSLCRHTIFHLFIVRCYRLLGFFQCTHILELLIFLLLSHLQIFLAVSFLYFNVLNI